MTVAVAGEKVAERRPCEVAVTFTEILRPTSPARTVYDGPVAPAIRSPPAYQRISVAAPEGDQRPEAAVSTDPTSGVPVILGVLLGTGPRLQV